MEASRNRLSIRRNALAVFALGATVASLAAVKLAPGAEPYARGLYDAARLELNQSDDPVSAAGGPRYDDGQLAKMPQKPLTAAPGTGFYDLVVCANPGGDIFSSGAAAAEKSYLERELQEQAGRDELWAGDSLKVPIMTVPGQKPDTRPSVCRPGQNTT